MSGRFLTKHDIAEAKRLDVIDNSQRKRGELTLGQANAVRSAHVVCGCGAPGCVFKSYRQKGEQ